MEMLIGVVLKKDEKEIAFFEYRYNKGESVKCQLRRTQSRKGRKNVKCQKPNIYRCFHVGGKFAKRGRQDCFVLMLVNEKKKKATTGIGWLYPFLSFSPTNDTQKRAFKLFQLLQLHSHYTP